ncbi:MAG: hypothetical protein ACRD0G_15310 [Acidimicrobiales bacterium]
MERPRVDPADEAHHEPGDDLLWNESWYFDFCAPDGSIGGWIRIGLYPNWGHGWYHALVCGPGRPTVAVVDQEVPLPKLPSLEIRSHGLWAEHVGTHPLERWQLANEAAAVAVDDPAELYRPDGARGDQVPMGLDLEWETDGEPYHYGFTTRYEIPCLVHGEILLGDERIELDGHGQRDHSWATRDWWQFGWTWTAGRLSDRLRFHGADVRVPNLRGGAGYLQPAQGAVVPAAWPDPLDGTVRAEEQLGSGGLPEAASVSIAGLALDIEPLAFAPVLLTGPEGQLSRFPRAMCRFTADDGRTGLGWTEWNQPQ